MATPDPKYERLQGVILPTEIVALPHILKTLDYLLMTHDEALIEAAETGQMAWIKQLLPSFSYDHLEVIIVAARRGQLTIVEWLVPEVRSHAGTEELNGKLDYNALDTLEEATINAAINGHLEVVKFLMPEVKICDEEEVGNDVDMLCEVAWRALDFTAKSGFLDVVKYLAEYARETEATGPASKMSQALANAIEEGHEEIVRFLINAPQFHWELDIAFNHALRLKNNKIMEIIFELHPECVDGGDLIFRLARDGKQYLQSPEIDWKLVDDAFLNAVLRERVDIIEILLKSGRVSRMLFFTTFIYAVRDGCIKSVSCLFNSKAHKYPWQLVTYAFENAGSAAVTKFLFDNACIPPPSIISAFKSALGLETRHVGLPHKTECSAIAVYLQSNTCIPCNVLKDGFQAAANNNFPDVVESIRGNDRLSSNVIIEAFSNAVDSRNYGIMHAAYDERIIPPQLINKKLLAISGTGLTIIIEFLLSKPGILSGTVKHAFINAAKHNRKDVIKLLWRKRRLGPEVLRKALSITTCESLKQFLRAKIAR